MMLAVGLEITENEYKLVDPVKENFSEMRNKKRGQRGTSSLPLKLPDATNLIEKTTDRKGSWRPYLYS